jgi:cell wall-associated NlpC family hydrolase
VALVSGMTAIAPFAAASPHPTVAEVEAQVQALQMKAAGASEQYNAAHLAYVRLSSQLTITRSRVAAEQATLGKVQSTIGAFAAATYQNGGIDASLQLLLADNPTQFLAQASVLDQIATNQNTALRSTRVARLTLLQTQNSLAQEEAQAAAVNQQMSAAQAAIDANLAAAKQLLGTLQQAERDRLARVAAAARAAQEAAARRLAAEQAAAAAAASSSANNGGDGSSANNGGGGGGHSTGYSGGGIPPVSGRAAIAVAYALSKVGDAYVAGDGGPTAVDCSGLTSGAWGAAGVYLDHYSYAQWSQVTPIPLNDIQPGDLLFYFGNGNHHVDIYVGGGLIVSASNESAGVEIINMNGPGYGWWANVFSGAGRPG